MSEETTDINTLKEEVIRLREQNNTLLDILEKRISLTRQNFKTYQSDDPSVGMRLTDQQRGWWEGRIETWEYALILARELFEK